MKEMGENLTRWLNRHGGHPYTQATRTMCSQLGLQGREGEESCWMLLDEYEKGGINEEDLLQGLCLATDLTPKEVLHRFGVG